MRRPCIAAIIGFGAVVASACNESELECAPFASTLAIKDKFDQRAEVFIVGEPIRFELQVTNRSRASSELVPDSCLPVRFFVSDRVGEIVWSTADVFCFAAPPITTFAPGETKTFDFEWRQQVRGGQAPEAPYTVHANGQAGRCLLDSAKFSIR